MLKRSSLIFALALAAGTVKAQVHILFDATKAETAGNADWVIDADLHNLKYGPNPYTSGSGTKSNPQRYPTPAQSTVTAGTAETYWEGSLSSWGIDCVNQGYIVEELPYNGQITYGNAGNVQDLSNYKIYVVDEPNIQFTSAEKTAIVQFVQHGGSLFMICDHTGSDRNNDGYDSPMIWNDLMNTNGIATSPFGIQFDLQNFSGTSSTISAAGSDSVIHGPMGSVTAIDYANGTSMTLNPSANSTVKGVIFKSGASIGNTNVLVAYGRYGSGKFAAIGDSSPADDGTGNPDCTLYSSYATAVSGNHRRLIMNITIWLAETDATNGVNEIADKSGISIYPNPSTGNVNLFAKSPVENVNVLVYDAAGRVVFTKNIAVLDNEEQLQMALPKGVYFVKAGNATFNHTEKLVVY
jgi:hypothetical protein